MEILALVLPLSLCLSVGFVGAYIWAVKTGQFSDTKTPAIRVLFDDEEGEDTGQNLSSKNQP